VSRKQPVAIDSSDDNNHQKSRRHPSKNVRQPCLVVVNHCKHCIQEDDDQSSSNYSTEDDNTSSDDNDEEDVDDGADDLQALDGDALASTLASEVMGFLSLNIRIISLIL
jgi:hypothetical protein